MLKKLILYFLVSSFFCASHAEHNESEKLKHFLQQKFKKIEKKEQKKTTLKQNRVPLLHILLIIFGGALILKYHQNIIHFFKQFFQTHDLSLLQSLQNEILQLKTEQKNTTALENKINELQKQQLKFSKHSNKNKKNLENLTEKVKAIKHDSNSKLEIIQFSMQSKFQSAMSSYSSASLPTKIGLIFGGTVGISGFIYLFYIINGFSFIKSTVYNIIGWNYKPYATVEYMQEQLQIIKNSTNNLFIEMGKQWKNDKNQINENIVNTQDSVKIIDTNQQLLQTKTENFESLLITFQENINLNIDSFNKNNTFFEQLSKDYEKIQGEFKKLTVRYNKFIEQNEETRDPFNEENLKEIKSSLFNLTSQINILSNNHEELKNEMDQKKFNDNKKKSRTRKPQFIGNNIFNNLVEKTNNTNKKIQEKKSYLRD
jgi:hypothetical protein